MQRDQGDDSDERTSSLVHGTVDGHRASALRLAVAVIAAAPLLMGAPLFALAQTTDSGDEAAEPAPRKPGELKVTLGRYFVHGDSGADGTDLNLRYRRDDTSVWLGAYRDRDFGSQVRAGAQTRWQPWPQVDVSLAPVLQVASRGFLGGSLTLEVGAPWFVQLGVGRTNLRPFINLNFDPSDAVTAAIGWRDDKVGAYALTVVRDDRLGTGQQNVHLNGEWQLPGDHRVTLELLRKTGRGEGAEVHALGFTATWALTHWFIRLSYDPKQNFSNSDVTRVSTGWRF